jgi:hypothetical protein
MPVVCPEYPGCTPAEESPTESDRSEEPDVDGIFTALAAAYVRGLCPDLPEAMSDAELLRHGGAAGL